MLYKGLEKISKIVSVVLGYLVSFLVVSCCAALFFQVIYRFIIVKFVSFSFPFTEEYARYALIWMTYLSISICYKEESMASVNLVYDKLHGKAKTAMFIITRLMILVFLVVVMVYGMRFVQNNRLFHSATMQVPGVFLHSAPLVGGIFLTYEWLTEVIGVLTGNLEPFESR